MLASCYHWSEQNFTISFSVSEEQGGRTHIPYLLPYAENFLMMTRSKSSDEILGDNCTWYSDVEGLFRSSFLPVNSSKLVTRAQWSLSISQQPVCWPAPQGLCLKTKYVLALGLHYWSAVFLPYTYSCNSFTSQPEFKIISNHGTEAL